MLKVILAVFRWYVFSSDSGSPYLGRIYIIHLLRSLLPALYVHRIFRSDEDRELHNHPWKWALSLVVTGGYIEERMEGIDGTIVSRVVKPWSFNLIRSDSYHCLTMLDAEKGAGRSSSPGRERRPGASWTGRAAPSRATWSATSASAFRATTAPHHHGP